MAYRTLGELRRELLARVGMGAMGASGGANQALIDSFLRNGQFQLYWATDWRHLVAYEDKTTGVGQTLYDYPVAAARNRRVLRVDVKHSGLWITIKEGITAQMRSTMTSQSVPARYERYAQIEVYPEPNQAYQVRVWYVADLQPFTADSDRATLDDEMVLLHATANAKAHYRQADAKMYEGQLNTLLGSLRGQSFGSNGVYRRGQDTGPEPKPVVIGR